MKALSAMGERVWRYTVKGFEKTSLRVEKTSFLFKETSLCGIMTAFQLLSPKANVLFTYTKPFFHLPKTHFTPLTTLH